MGRLFLRYLRDFSGRAQQSVLDRWLAGNADDAFTQEARGRILTCEEIAELPFEAIQMFYGQEEKPQEEMNGSEGT